MRFVLILVVSCVLAGQFHDWAHAQPPDVAEVSIDDVPVLAGERTDSFRRQVIKAARTAARDGKIKRTDVPKIRVALLSRGFRETAKRLFVIETVFSTSDHDLPRKASGAVDYDRMNWVEYLPQLIEFIKVLLDLLVEYGILDVAQAEAIQADMLARVA